MADAVMVMPSADLVAVVGVGGSDRRQRHGHGGSDQGGKKSGFHWVFLWMKAGVKNSAPSIHINNTPMPTFTGMTRRGGRRQIARSGQGRYGVCKIRPVRQDAAAIAWYGAGGKAGPATSN